MIIKEKNFRTRGHSVECLPPPCYIVIGTALLPMSADAYIKVKQVNIVLTIVPVQPQACTVALFYAKPSSHSVVALVTDWCPECLLDHFHNIHNIINFSVVCSLPFHEFHKTFHGPTRADVNMSKRE